jgi:hypothetical protein
MNKEEKKLKRLIIPLEYNKKFIAKGDGRRYHDSILLKEGEYTDSISMTAVFYSGEELKKVASSKYYDLDGDDKIYLNVDHEPYRALSRIGYVYNIHYNNKSLKGDLYLHRLTTNSKDAVVLIDSGYVTGLSVEILTDDEYIDGKIYARDIELIGLALVTDPACPSSHVVTDG